MCPMGTPIKKIRRYNVYRTNVPHTVQMQEMPGRGQTIIVSHWETSANKARGRMKSLKEDTTYYGSKGFGL